MLMKDICNVLKITVPVPPLYDIPHAVVMAIHKSQLLEEF